MRFLKGSKVYLDHASGAFIKKSSYLSFKKILGSKIGNSASIHSYGQDAKKNLDKSRKIVADAISANTRNIVFTSSATESIAIYIQGVVFAARKKYEKPHIITSTIEHSAVLKNFELLKDNNLVEVTYIKPNTETGLINASSIIKEIKPNTVLVSIHSVNSEIGIIQDIYSFIKNLNSYKEEKYGIKNMRFINKPYYPYLHVDATQSFAHMDISNYVLKGVDAMSFNSSKIGGPTGVGVLYFRSNTDILPMYAGGSQEFGLRPGTVDVPSIYAFSKAIEKNKISELENKYKDLKEYLILGINKIKERTGFDFVQNSSENCIPSIVSLSFPYFTGQQMAVELDARNVLVSSKSACNIGEEGESYVVSEIRNISKEKTYNNYGTIRISFGQDTTKKDINKLLNELEEIIITYKGVLY